ncbi:MAG TPA: gephyrin-like molybdotransferase Glp [Gaiellaceae bacterium]|nr:gephyrin-like molybdotransferase Glp [Gaiellaceae bacterium]
MAELLTIEEAQRLVLEHVRPLQPERVALELAASRVLAEAAHAVVDLPPFPSSAMDGFAVRAADTPGTLPVVFRVAAGQPAPGALRPGESMGIATGGVVPDGADAVIPFEYVVDHDNEVEIGSAVEPGANVRPRGGDLQAGAQVVQAGAQLGPAHLGALAAAGVAEVVCGGVPRAAVLATGTELRRPGEPLGPGEVYEANGLILAAQLTSAGASVERLPAVADDEDAHREALARGLEHDVLVTSGGVSVGPHDLVRRVESELGVEEVFWRVAVKPGKPVSFGVRERTLVFGLPGNPVSSLVGFELFVRPALLALQGHAEPMPRFEPGRLTTVARRNPNRDQLVRARTRTDDAEAVELEPLAGQESHMIATAAGADALVLIPRGEGELDPGSPVRYLRLG